MGLKVNKYEHIEEIDTYFEEIKHLRPLSREEEKELSDRIKKGDASAKEKLVKHNLKFVVAMAKNYRDRGVPFNDLISEGNIGLMRAADKFDGDKNIKFISYAVWWVKNSFNECINNYAANNEKNAEDYVFVNVKDVLTDDNLINEEFEDKLIELQSRKNCVKELMKCLHEREIKILTLFYGLNDGREMTLDEVGSEMNLTMERVRQIKDSALMKLKCRALTLNKEDRAMAMNLR